MLSLIAFAAALAAAPPQRLDEASVRAVETGWSEAVMTGDTATLDALLAPGYVSISATGAPHDKAALLKGATNYAAQHPGQHAKPLPASSTVELIGTTALVRHHGEKETSMDLFSFQSGRWLAIYSQHTTIAPPA